MCIFCILVVVVLVRVYFRIVQKTGEAGDVMCVLFEAYDADDECDAGDF